VTVATALVGTTIPLAGLLISQSKDDSGDLVNVLLISAIGLIISLTAAWDDYIGLSDWFGFAIEAMSF
jgi:hypothetical protein